MSTKRMTFPPLSGGLDLAALDFGGMPPRRSPKMQNLWWQDGYLRSRPGQVRLNESVGEGRAAFGEDFHGWGFFHAGTALLCADLGAKLPLYHTLMEDVGQVRGTFFRYGEALYYKTKGHFVRIVCEGEGVFSARSLLDTAYVPTVLMNADPVSGAGDLYQQENRLTGRMRVCFTPDGVTKRYRLPVGELDAVESVTLNGESVTATADLGGGAVVFPEAPVGEANSLCITFRKENPEALHALMSCTFAAVYGSGTEVCMVLGGSAEAPSTVFWNGNDAYGMNDAYFPMACYNRCGDSAEAVTGFGRQYERMILLKEHSVGCLEGCVEEVEEKAVISLTYSEINTSLGCDLPWTVGLVENNLVFCHSRLGVQVLRSASAAYENNLKCVSTPIHGGAARTGLLAALREEPCPVAFDDGRCYWLCAAGQVYLWDYSISTADDPSWFYFTNIRPAAFVRRGQEVFHLGCDGALVAFRDTLSDFGGAIEKVYRFPTQSLGSYHRRKDVTELHLALRPAADSDIVIDYETDFGTYRDPCTVRGYVYRLAPRNLGWRCLGLRPFAQVETRRPPARDVRHFAMELSNAAAGQDLGIVSAELRWRETRREK